MIPLSQQPNQGRQEALLTRTQSLPLRGRPLVILRTLWGLIVLFEVGVLLVNFPALLSVLHTACSDATGVSCNYLQLRSSQLPALAHYGFSLDGYAFYALFCDLAMTLLFLSVGILIFWRKSDEFMGLFVSLLLLTFGCFGVSEVHLIVPLPFLAELIVGLLIILQWPALGHRYPHQSYAGLRHAHLHFDSGLCWPDHRLAIPHGGADNSRNTAALRHRRFHTRHCRTLPAVAPPSTTGH